MLQQSAHMHDSMQMQRQSLPLFQCADCMHRWMRNRSLRCQVKASFRRTSPASQLYDIRVIGKTDRDLVGDLCTRESEGGTERAGPSLVSRDRGECGMRCGCKHSVVYFLARISGLPFY